MKLFSTCVILFLGIGLFAGQPVWSQDIARNETVANRARPELDPSGVPIGAFRLFPQLAITYERNSNIFADGLTELSDVIYVVSPEFELRSDWNNHAVDLGASADISRFSDFEGEDHSDLDVWASGRLDISRSAFLAGSVAHSTRHEGRDSADDVRGEKRTRFDIDSIAVSYQLRPGLRKFRALFEAEFANLDFDDVLDAEITINNDDRDRKQVHGTMRIGYDALPTNSFFFQASVESTEYDSQFDDDGFERSSDGYELAIGSTLDYSGVTFGDVFLGYRSRRYDDQRYEKIDGLSFGAEVAWNLSGLTTITVSGSRTVESTTIVDAAGIQATKFRLGVQHELLRNLILSLAWTTGQDDYRGIDRKDDNDTTAIGARYLMNRRVELVLGYTHRRRDTTPDTTDGFTFSRDVYRATIEVHL
jgi:hypothetical protein